MDGLVSNVDASPSRQCGSTIQGGDGGGPHDLGVRRACWDRGWTACGARAVYHNEEHVSVVEMISTGQTHQFHAVCVRDR